MSVAGCGTFCHGGYGGVNPYLSENTIHGMIHQSSIMTSELLYHLLLTTEAEPADEGDDNSIHSGGCLIDGAVDGGIQDKITKFEMLHKWWDDLHDFEESTQLNDAMKRHLYKIKFGNDAIDMAHEMINFY